MSQVLSGQSEVSIHCGAPNAGVSCAPPSLFPLAQTQAMTQMTSDSSRWWGHFELARGAPKFWGIGPLGVVAERRDSEWLLRFMRESDPLSARVIVASADVPLVVVDTSSRIGFRSAPAEIELRVALADRPVVVRADQALCIPAGERVTLHVSTAAWLQIAFGGQGPVIDIPTMRPPDAWFGPNTREGELCYSSRTRAKFDPEDAGHWASRPITPVRVRNNSGTPLLIEQIKLPLPNLAVYADQAGHLWTDAVLMECTEASGSVMVRIDHRERPREDLVRIGAARLAVANRRIPEAFALLFGTGMH